MNTKIKIVGVGEGGAKTISKLIQAGVGKDKSVEFIAIGNDENIMLTSAARKNVFLNRDLTIIYKSIFDALDGAKVIIIVAGLAGNAARSAIPIIMSYAKTYDAATVAFVCKPSILENFSRKSNAAYTINNLLGKVDTLFAVPAEKFFVFRINQPQISLHELFDVADDVFCQGVKILLELKDLKFGNAALGYGEANTALDAVKLAAKFPTLEEDEFKTAQKVFVRLTSGNSLSKSEIDAANKFIKAQLPAEAEFTSRAEVVPLLAEKVFASIICTRK
ncbi:MAG: hypothetical protein IJQ01_05520 [Selenomonadaceae bacterium]|nr:hypothetical protein [Selenomonadaceae bacterium]MBR0102938.1 hypothetical protein [Selenomonadaceae bacterium]